MEPCSHPGEPPLQGQRGSQAGGAGQGVEGMRCFYPREGVGSTKGTQRHIRLCLLLGIKAANEAAPGPQSPRRLGSREAEAQERSGTWGLMGSNACKGKGGAGLSRGATNQVMAPTDRRLSSGQAWPGPWPSESWDPLRPPLEGHPLDLEDDTDPEEEQEAKHAPHLRPGSSLGGRDEDAPVGPSFAK